jgi:hypothetical protein
MNGYNGLLFFFYSMTPGPIKALTGPVLTKSMNRDLFMRQGQKFMRRNRKKCLNLEQVSCNNMFKNNAMHKFSNVTPQNGT